MDGRVVIRRNAGWCAMYLFFQAEDGIRGRLVTGVQTCALPICPPRVKAGHISKLTLKELDADVWDKPALAGLAEELSMIIEQHDARSDCFVEMDREGCKILQIGDLRITCAWPPFSDAWEITVVRPVAHLKIRSEEHTSELQSQA